MLKVHDLAPEMLAETEILDEVRRMLATDRDAAVVANCLIVLKEIDGEPAMATKQNVYGLINRIKDFSEWSQVTILEVVALYPPQDKSETFDIMNALEDRLQHANSAVVLATVKVFLRATLDMADVHQQVFERLKAPLLTLAAAGSAEPAYAVWAHLHLLVTRAPPLFNTDFKSFFCRASDPPAVKKLKIEMLTAVADSGNTYDIVSELSEYVTDVDAAIARESVRAVGRVALEGDQNAGGIVDRLLQFLDHGTDYVTAETLVAIKDLLRRHPRWADDCIVAVSGIEVDAISEPQARAALVFIYGEYGHAMPEAPYMLEPLLAAFEEEEAEDVRLELLAAAMKLFFTRAPEMRAMLGEALVAGTADANQDVHDRAMMYARLLHHDPEAAARVVGCAKETITNFSDGASLGVDKYAEQIFKEFNTLSVMYQKPGFLFTEDAPAMMPRAPSFPETVGGANAAGELGAGYDAGGASGAVLNSGNAFPGDSLIDLDGSGGAGAGDLLGGGGDFLGASRGGFGGGGGGSAAGATSGEGNSGNNLLDLLDVPLAASASAAPPPPPPLVLDPAPVLDAGTFQQRWGVLPLSPGCASGPRALALGSRTAAQLQAPQPLMSHLAALGFATMASGGAPPAMKFYFYGASADGGGLFLVEAVVNPAACSAHVTVKTDAGADRAAAAEGILAAALASFAA